MRGDQIYYREKLHRNLNIDVHKSMIVDICTGMALSGYFGRRNGVSRHESRVKTKGEALKSKAST